MNFSKLTYLGLLLIHISSIRADKLPIVYTRHYNISFWGLEKLHPFESKKYEKVARFLSNYFNTPINQLFHEPATMISHAELLQFHTPEYLASLTFSSVIAKITELPPLSIAPHCVVKSAILNPMKWATAGTRLAAQIAWNNQQYAINLGGGFHHANADRGGGFCMFGDIQLAMLDIWGKKPNAKIMYIDLDAHQGDGVELGLEPHIKNTDPAKPRLVVFDIYGRDNYPGYNKARDYIQYGRSITDLRYHRRSAVTDAQYLDQVAELATIIPHEQPDIIFYNAGSDIYEHDPLGRLNISQDGIIHRDEMVFRFAKQQGIPIVMTLSGGYTKESAQIIGKSIANLLEKVWDVKPLLPATKLSKKQIK